MKGLFRWMACLVALGACAGPSKPGPQATTERPNILFLFADDQRRDTIGALGNEHIRTPHLDRLAQGGFSFQQNYCMGSTGGAVCRPSRAMLMSGRTLFRAPMNLEDVQTLPMALAEAGYRTFGTGKWHNGAASFERSFQAGKNVFIGGMSDHLKVPVRDLLEDGTLGPKRFGESFSSELFADAAIEFLLDQEGSQEPFFAYVSFSAPHDPRQPPLAYRQAYYEKRPPLPANFLPQHPFHNGWMVGRDETLAAWPRTPEVLSDQLCEYYGMITHMDEQIGRILEALERSGHGDNTLIVFSADHGLAMGSHGLLGKQSVYEHSMGAPLILAGPAIPRGSSEALTYLYDLYPTLASLAGAPVPDGLEGFDLGPLWRGEQASVRDSLYLIYEDKMRALRAGRFKLIRYPLIDHMQLFDLQSDPLELINLASEPRYQGVLDRLWIELQEQHQRWGDPHPLRVPEPASMAIQLDGRPRKPDAHQPTWIVDKYF